MKHIRPESVVKATKAETLFDVGYDHGLFWGEGFSNECAPNSWGAKAQYKAGVKLGQQESRKRKLQQLVMKDPS